MKNRCMKENKKEYGMPKTNSDFKTGNSKKEKDEYEETSYRKEVKIENRGWKKHKGRDILRILSATYCSKRTKAAKNSGNVVSHSGTLTIK